MSDVVEDMLGRKFDVEQDEKGNEVWRSQEYPEFTFKSIEKYKDEDGNCLLYADKFGASTIEYDEANEIIRKKENNVTEYPTELVDIMPVTNQMFVPLVNNKVVLDGNFRDNAVACNAKQDHGILEKREYIKTTRYHGAYVAPGSMVLAAEIASVYGSFRKETNVLYRNIKRKTATIDTPLEQVKTVASMLNTNQELSDAIPYSQFNEIMTDLAKNASLALKEHPEQAQQIFDAFNSIKQSDVDKETKSFSTDFYVALAKNTPQVFIDNASSIPPFQRIGRLPNIAKEHKELALGAFDAMPSLKSHVEYHDFSSYSTHGIGFDIDKACKAFCTFLGIQLPSEDKEKMLTTLLNDKVTIIELFYDDRNDGIRPHLDNFTNDNNKFSDEFCKAVVNIAKGYYDGVCLGESIGNIIEKQKTLSVEFCKDMGEYTRHNKNYTGEYLQALEKLPTGVDKTEFYKDLVYIVTKADAYSRLKDKDEKAAIDYVAQSPEKLSPEFCDYMIETAKDMSDWEKTELQPILKRVLNEDISYFYTHRDVFNNSEFIQQVALRDHSIIPSLKNISKENFDAFAKIYEDEYKNASYGIDENNLKQKNVVLEKENNEIMDTIKTKILESSRGYYDASISKPVQVWLVKNAQKYPNLVGEILKEEKLPYVEMCIKNIENPEKENIASLLNRLEVKEAKTFEDFQDAQDFVARRDMCMRACRTYDNEKQKEFHAEHPEEDNVHLATIDRSQLSYDMAEVGIDDFKTAKRVAKLFYALNERPAVYGSDYNQYYPQALLPIAKSDVMQDWMYPVMMDAIEKGGLTISEGRMPSERTLFDCCKAWKINPAMPQRLAKFVGTHSLKGRMLAGAIFDKMVTDGKTTPEEWRDNKVLHEKFYEELARAEKMPREKAFQQYIPNTPVNRKRVIGMGMEEKGIENTPENFKALYKEAREQGVFEKLLAKPEEARTTFSSRLLVETARRKAARE